MQSFEVSPFKMYTGQDKNNMPPPPKKNGKIKIWRILDKQIWSNSPFTWHPNDWNEICFRLNVYCYHTNSCMWSFVNDWEGDLADLIGRLDPLRGRYFTHQFLKYLYIHVFTIILT